MKNNSLAAIQNNLSELQTSFADTTVHQERVKSREWHAAEHPVLLSSLIEQTLNDIAREINIGSQLIKIKKLMHLDLPVNQRPQIFRQLNLLLGALCYYRQGDRESYLTTHDIMTLMHRQIDALPQTEDELEEAEWNELQKAAYLLTDWDSQTANVNPSYATLMVNPR